MELFTLDFYTYFMNGSITSLLKNGDIYHMLFQENNDNI